MATWTQDLLTWFKIHQRPMPWRSDPTPYKVWVSEIMLQQTGVETVIPYFNRFIKLFPSAKTLAKADLGEVLKAWEGLGYYSRARNLHKAAKDLVERFNGKFPQISDPQEFYQTLQTFPGLGPYTAAAVASIAFGHPIPVVDGNVLRVFSRFWGIDKDIRHPKSRIEIFDRLKPFIQTCSPSDFNQAIMELGALVCRPKSPQCPLCPLRKDCRAFLEGKTTSLPLVSKRAPVPHYEIAIAVIWQRGKLLIGKRRTDQMLGGLWEFPGGKRKKGESLEETAIRETREETGLSIEIEKPYCTIQHAYTHFKITLTAFKAKVLAGRARPHSTDELRFVSLKELELYPFPTANKKVIQVLNKEVECSSTKKIVTI